ncbi:MAG: immunoglobulin domain-containing protein, partial [Opitutus sp.]
MLVATAGSIAGAFAQAPANDHFANAQVLTGSSGWTTGSNVAATGEPGEPVHGVAYATASSIWYAWAAPASGALVLSTVGSFTATSHAVYTGTALNNLVHLATDNTSGLSAFEKRAVSVAAGMTYFIAVGSRFDQGDRGFISLTYAFHEQAVISGEPASRTAIIGDSVSFGVTAIGTDLSYQWFHNGIALAGARSSTLVLNNVQP